MKTQTVNLLARLLKSFFAEHVPGTRALSPHTLQSYRDSLVLLLRFLSDTSKRDVTSIDIEDITPENILAFLAYLETDRHNAVVTRNVRLAAIHAFFRYAASQNPELLEKAQRIIAIPGKRTRSRTMTYLESEELQALLATIDRSSRLGRRDYALLALLFNTGGRIQEVLDIRVEDLQLIRPYHVRLFGKGRKERYCPLWPQTVEVLKAWCQEEGLAPNSSSPLFRNHRGQPLSRFGARYIVHKYGEKAGIETPSLAKKRIHPHVMRHYLAKRIIPGGSKVRGFSLENVGIRRFGWRHNQRDFKKASSSSSGL